MGGSGREMDDQEMVKTTRISSSTGGTEWVFESLQDESQLDAIDKNVFWVGTYAWVLVWSTLLFVNIISLSLSWVVFLIIANTFAWTNLVAYWKCSRDQKSKLQTWAMTTMASNATGLAGGFFQKFGLTQ